MVLLIDALKKFWQDQGIILNAGASEAELSSFEAKHSVCLPNDFRGCFLAVNGFDESENWADNNVIAFLSLNEVKPLSEYWSAEIAGAEAYFVFADHSISVHVYAICLSEETADRDQVVVVYNSSLVKVANSFSEFVEGYLANDDGVLFPQPSAQ